MKNNNDYSSGGLGTGGVLGLIFIVLKLVGVIDWSWLWVLAPIWISVAISLIALVIYTIIIVSETKKW